MAIPGLRGYLRVAKQQKAAAALQSDGWVFVSSSNVKAIRMFREPSLRSEREAFIEVWFLNGMIYTYLGDLRTYNALIKAGSKGKAVHRLLVPRGYVRKRQA